MTEREPAPDDEKHRLYGLIDRLFNEKQHLYSVVDRLAVEVAVLLAVVGTAIDVSKLDEQLTLADAFSFLPDQLQTSGHITPRDDLAKLALGRMQDLLSRQ